MIEEEHTIITNCAYNSFYLFVCLFIRSLDCAATDVISVLSVAVAFLSKKKEKKKKKLNPAITSTENESNVITCP